MDEGSGTKCSTNSSLKVTDSPYLLAVLVLVRFLSVVKCFKTSARSGGTPVYHVSVQLAVVILSESSLVRELHHN